MSNFFASNLLINIKTYYLTSSSVGTFPSITTPGFGLKMVKLEKNLELAAVLDFLLYTNKFRDFFNGVEQSNVALQIIIS